MSLPVLAYYLIAVLTLNSWSLAGAARRRPGGGAASQFRSGRVEILMANPRRSKQNGELHNDSR